VFGGVGSEEVKVKLRIVGVDLFGWVIAHYKYNGISCYAAVGKLHA
jgi:hypothetical protein